MDSKTDIHGGNNQILPNATHAEQNFYNFRCPLSKPEQAEDMQIRGEYHLYVLHDSVNVPALIRNAKQQIVLHAAYYPKYGIDDQGKTLYDALESNPHLKLRVIFTEIDNNPWIDEFAKILRHFVKTDLQKDAMRLSMRYFIGMRESLNDKNQISICSTVRLPMFPVILIDDTIVVGHYAHSKTPAPHGFWMTIKHQSIPDMYNKLCRGTICRSSYKEEELAILRYLEELCIDEISSGE